MTREGTAVLAGMSQAYLEQLRAVETARGEALTAEMLQPRGDISRKAGRMEKDSPLFFGSGENPSLF